MMETKAFLEGIARDFRGRARVAAPSGTIEEFSAETRFWTGACWALCFCRVQRLLMTRSRRPRACAATCLCTIGMNPRRIDLIRSTGARRCSSLAPRVLCRSAEHRSQARIASRQHRRAAHRVVLLRSSGNNGKWLRRNIPSDWQRAVATAQGSFAASLISIFVRCEASNS